LNRAWLEGLVEGVTGWAIGEQRNEQSSASADAASLYEKIERAIAPMFHEDRKRHIDIMRHGGSHFNSQRILQQYLSNAYLR
jgi:glycogen phosphorylase